MTSYTPFLKLALPPFDTAPWDQAVNGNMTTIDAFISRYMAVPNYVGAWTNGTNYISGQTVLDITDATIYQCQVSHISSIAPTTFAQDRATYPTYWVRTTNVVSAGAAISIGDVPPLVAKPGDLWFESVHGQLYVYYNDGNSLQWVVAINQAGSIGDAPYDGRIYARQNGGWQPSTIVSDVGRNLIHNSMFNIAQRGTGPWTTGATTDRWRLSSVLDTDSINLYPIDDNGRAQIGDEAAVRLLQNSFTGNAGATAQSFLIQAMEGVRRFAGKTVIVSFWANSSTTLKLGINISQVFGTGGSPSTGLWVNATGQQVTTTAIWTRYSVTFAIPSVTGKTLGTNGDDYTGLAFFYTSGATNNAAAGNIGVQSGAINLWGVQLEIAQPGQTQPTPLEKPDPELQLRQCQRFYQTGYQRFVVYQQAGSGSGTAWPLAVAMRAQPTVTNNITTQTNCTGSSIGPYDNQTLQLFGGTATANGPVVIVGTYTASADL